MPNCQYVRASTVEEAVDSLQASGGEGHVFAGGVALGILMNSKLLSPTWIVDIARIDALRKIEPSGDGGLRIGALVTHSEVEHSALVAERAPLLHAMAREIACGRVRNRGTIGGNVCFADPQGDPPAALLALEAVLRVRGPAGPRSIPIGTFFEDTYETALGEAEVLEAIEVPPMAQGACVAFGKFGARKAMDYASTISAAVVVVGGQGGAIGEVRIGMGGVGKTPVRPAAVEAVLRGEGFGPDVRTTMENRLKDELDPVSDLTYSADYKRHVAAVLLGRTVESALREAGD